MNAEAMLEVLKRDFGINNREEFETACKNFTGLDIGIFITPVGEVTENDRILRFDDEIRHKTRHSKEHFDQIIEDVDTYERYCRDHPRFPNGKAVSATDNVKRTYEKCKAENSFL